MSTAPYERYREITLENDSVETSRDKTIYSIDWAGTPGEDGYAESTYSATETSSWSAGNSSKLVTQAMTDVVVPGFKKLSAKGQIFCNPMRRVITSYDNATAHAHHAYLQWLAPYVPASDWPSYPVGLVYDGEYPSSYLLGKSPTDLIAYVNSLDVDVDSVKALAVTKAHANIKVSEVEILASLGEMKETIGFLRHTMKRAIRIFRAVKRLDLKYLSRINKMTLNELSDLYMEYRYAVRPLIIDTQNIAKAIKAGSSAHDRYTFRGYASDREAITPTQLDLSNSTKSILAEITGYREVSARSGVLCSLDDVSALQIWGLDKPIEAMWETTPFSFIGDWFFNIGQTIESWTPNYGIRDLASWVTVKDEIHCECRITHASSLRDSAVYNHTNDYSVQNARIAFTQRAVERFVNPQRSFVPQFNMRLDCFKILDLAIIIKTLCSKNRDKAMKVAMYKRS